MKIEELKIGNLVKAKNNKIDFFYVTDILRSGYLFLSDGYEDGYDSSIKDIEPIELTDEWLTKLGFESDGIEWWNGIICLGIYKDGLNYLPTEEIHYRVGQKFEYVHQIQNLHYAITGDELNVLI